MLLQLIFVLGALVTTCHGSPHQLKGDYNDRIGDWLADMEAVNGINFAHQQFEEEFGERASRDVAEQQYSTYGGQQNSVADRPRNGNGARGQDNQCPPDQVLLSDGSCSVPDISQNVFVYGSPFVTKGKPTEQPKVPRPKIEYNVVVIRSDKNEEENKPIIVPPPQQKTVVLVLNKEGEEAKKNIVELESEDHEPEVYFIDYKEGDNPALPGGIDLQTALGVSVNDASRESTDSTNINAIDSYNARDHPPPLSYIGPNSGSQSFARGPEDQHTFEPAFQPHVGQYFQNIPSPPVTPTPLPPPRQRYSNSHRNSQRPQPQVSNEKTRQRFSIIKAHPPTVLTDTTYLTREYRSVALPLPRPVNNGPSQPQQQQQQQQQQFTPQYQETFRPSSKVNYNRISHEAWSPVQFSNEEDSPNQQLTPVDKVKAGTYLGRYRLPNL